MNSRIKADPSTLLSLAATQIGYSENPPGSNNTKYGHWYGLNRNPWCAMFVSWVHYYSNNPLPYIRTARGFAYVPDVWNYAGTTGQAKRVGSYAPKPGDMVIFSFGRRRPDHIGFVEKNLGDAQVQTIEGNTNGAGSRTGGSVLRKIRRAGIIGYVSVDSTLSQTPPMYKDIDLSEANMYIAVSGVGFFAQIGNVTIPLEGVTMAQFGDLQKASSCPTMVLPGGVVANDFIKKAMQQTVAATGG